MVGIERGNRSLAQRESITSVTTTQHSMGTLGHVWCKPKVSIINLYSHHRSTRDTDHPEAPKSLLQKDSQRFLGSSETKKARELLMTKRNKKELFIYLVSVCSSELALALREKAFCCNVGFSTKQASCVKQILASCLHLLA